MIARLTPTGWDSFDKILGGLPKGGVVIIAGHPGTGKTILSAKLIYEGAYRYGEPGVYASFAEDRHRFYENMSGLGLDFEKLERDGRFAYLDLPVVGRLGVSSIVELMIEATEKLKAKRLVVDSFTTLAQTFKDRAELRTFVHSILSRIVKDLDCTTILIEEIPIGVRRIGFGVEEFIADAILILRRREFDGRSLRDLAIVKLRGVELKEDKFIFTLSDGVKVFPPFTLPKLEGYRLTPPPEDLSEEVYSTGIKDLDRAIGGYPKGSTVILEVDSKVDDIGYRFNLILPLAYSFIRKHRPVIIIPSLNATHVDVISYAKYIEWPDKMEKLLRVVEVGPRIVEAEHPYLITLEGRDIREDYDRLLEYIRRFTEGRKPPLAIVGMDTLVARYGLEDSIRIISLSIVETRRVGALNVIVAKPVHRRIQDVLPSISSIHLKLTREHGALLLYGVKPRTELYVVETSVSKEGVETRLTPIR